MAGAGPDESQEPEDSFESHKGVVEAQTLEPSFTH